MEKNSLKPIGELFETIQYVSKNDIDNLIDNLDSTQSFYFINLALQLAVKNNIYDITEIEIISKSLRKIELINSLEKQNDRGDQIKSDN